MKKIIFILIFFLLSNSYAKDTIEAQADIIFNHKKLKRNQKKLLLKVKFNKAILLLEKKEYKKAIKIFEDTRQILKIPSLLNIAISNYKLGFKKKAETYFYKIYKTKNIAYLHSYSYLSACFYLYKIKNDDIYLKKIILLSKKYKSLGENSKRILSDTYIILKEYKKSLIVLNSMKKKLFLKQAMLNIKLNKLQKARGLLSQAKNNTYNQEKLNLIYWITLFRDLKSNDIISFQENINDIKKIKSKFKTNLKYPLEIFFNKNKYSPKDYITFISKFNISRQIDFVFYFAPFIFSNNEEILYDTTKGFIINSSKNIKNLEEMLNYNVNLINIIKDDQIIRINKLKLLMTKNNKSYMYYNLALCYAQINDFNNAFKYFSKAYKLNPGNKLYAIMSILSSQKINKTLTNLEYIKTNIRSNNGSYKYFGHQLYKLIINKKFISKITAKKYNKTALYYAIDYLHTMNNNKLSTKHIFFKQYYKDPLIFLMNNVIRENKENDLQYFARLQDTIPLHLNNNFLEGSFTVGNYYIDLLKALGLFNKTNLLIQTNNSPTYLLLKAFNDLYKEKSNKTIDTLEYLQKQYKLENKYTMYLLVAALLNEKRYNDASIQISLINALFKDNTSNFLTGIQLIQELKLKSAKEYIKKPFHHDLIDFKIKDFDKLLEAL